MGVLFHADTEAALLAKMVGVLGSLPRRMLNQGKFVNRYFIGSFTLFEKQDSESGYDLLYPKRTSLRKKLDQCDDHGFVDFLALLLTLDPELRPSADLASQHSWLTTGPQ